MHKQLAVLLLLLLIVGGFFLAKNTATAPTTDNEPTAPEPEVTERSYGVARDAAFGYEFSYPDGPDGYLTFENTDSTHPDFLTGIMLMDRTEYEILQASTDAREGPPAIHVQVYENPANRHAPVWAMENQNETNYGLLLGTETETTLGGANAIRYTTDGLYPIDTYVAAHDGRIYVLMGAYRDIGDQIHEDFQDLVASFTFIQNSEPQG